MARATRIALDIALVSLKIMRPTVSKIWSVTKSVIIYSPAKRLVSHPVVRSFENKLDQFTGLLEKTMVTLRDRQLHGEVKYLEKELVRVKKLLEAKRLQKGPGSQGQKYTSKSLRPTLGVIWQYAKVEMIPPMTHAFFNGAPGKKLEDSVSAAADNFIAGLQNKIKQIEEDEARRIREKEAAIKAAQEKAKAEAKKKAEELKRKEEEKAAAEAKKAKAAAEKKAKAKAVETKAVEAKPKAAEEKAKTPEAKAKVKDAKTEAPTKPEPKAAPKKETPAKPPQKK